MKALGYDRPLYVLPFDHRGSFQTKLFGWRGALTTDQAAELAASKRVIYDAFRQAITSGLAENRAGILVDEQFVLATASGVPGFIGFAVGRTSFWDLLVNWRAKNIDRDQAVEDIAAVTSSLWERSRRRLWSHEMNRGICC